MQRFETREQWLKAAAEEFAELIEAETGRTVPAIRIGVGYPSAGKRSNVIGECWTPKASADGTHEIIIRLDRTAPAEPQGVLSVLLHEECHAVAGIHAGHGTEFKRLVSAVGLEGKATATKLSDELAEAFEAWSTYGSLGAYPMATFNPTGLGTPRRPGPEDGGPISSGPKTQTTRMIKAECTSFDAEGGFKNGCGYTVRLTRKWLDVAMPLCPNPECERQGEPLN